MKLNFIRVSGKKRKSYKYYDANEKLVVTLTPNAANGISEIHIKLLHSMDDAEVYNNIKNHVCMPEVKGSDKSETKGEWKDSPRWTLSLDQMMDENDRNFTLSRRVLEQASESLEKPSDPLRELLHEAVGYLEPCQQKLFRQYYIDEMTLTEIGKKETPKVSAEAVRKRLKRIENQLKDIIFKKILHRG